MARIRSIRGRLTLLNLALISALFLVLVAAQWLLLGAYLRRQQEFTLRSAVVAAIDRRAGGPEAREPTIDRFAARLAADLSSRDTLALVIDGAGQLILPSRAATPPGPVPAPIPGRGGLPPPRPGPAGPPQLDDESLAERALRLPLPPPELVARARSGDGQVGFTAMNPEGEWFSVLMPLPQLPAATGGARPVLLAAASSEPSRVALNGLLIINAAAFAVVVLAVVGTSALAARGALRPLSAMVDVAQRIERGDLAQRAPAGPESPEEVAQLAHSFNAMVDQLLRQLEQQRRLVADASHELRTPLTAIQGSLDVLLMRGDGQDPATAQRLLGTARHEVARLVRLVNDLLALHNAERGASVELSDVHVSALVEDVLTGATALAEQHGKVVRFDVNADRAAMARADADHLRQVLLNLLDNAIKFSPDGGVIRVEVQAAAGKCTIQVRDDGPGIAPDELRRVFERFHRGDSSRARSTGGSGLGLAIARALVEGMGGTIAVRSAPGEGSTFAVSLPVSDLQNPKGSDPNPKGLALNPKGL